MKAGLCFAKGTKSWEAKHESFDGRSLNQTRLSTLISPITYSILSQGASPPPPPTPRHWYFTLSNKSIELKVYALFCWMTNTSCRSTKLLGSAVCQGCALCKRPTIMHQSIPSLTIPPGDHPPGDSRDSNILVAPGVGFRLLCPARGLPWGS